MRYIENAPCRADEGIDTFEKAEYKLRLMESAASRVAHRIAVRYRRTCAHQEGKGVHRPLGQRNADELRAIEAAYEAVNSTGKLSFPI